MIVMEHNDPARVVRKPDTYWPPNVGKTAGPSALDLRRAICCPGGVCIAPDACYASDPTRSYPVHIPSAAEAVARLLCERWRAVACDNMETQR